MDNDSIDRLKFDRRMAARRDWVSGDEMEQELGSLPDAADKMLGPDEEPEKAPSLPKPDRPAPPPPPEPAFGAGGTMSFGDSDDDDPFAAPPPTTSPFPDAPAETASFPPFPADVSEGGDDGGGTSGA